MKSRYYFIFTFFMMMISTAAYAQQNVEVVNAYPNLSFAGPIDYQFASANDNLVYVAEREGRIVSFINSDTTTQLTEVLDISGSITTVGEGGLLGFSFHPEYPDSAYLYVSYTVPNPYTSVISRFDVDQDGIADPASEFILLELEQPFANHNGGQIQFGPDGYLYIAFGDGGDQGDPLNHGQRPETLLGSLLRINIDSTDTGLNYSIPADNPFAGLDTTARKEVYAFGFRNPWRFSFDTDTGELWVADVGQSSKEEIDVVISGGNYGWNVMEGFECYPNDQPSCDKNSFDLPVFEYPRSEGVSITGGYVYRGTEVPELNGRYIYADFGTNRIWSLAWDGENATDNQLISDGEVTTIITFGQDQQGEVYFGSFDGNIYKFESTVATNTEQENDKPVSVQLDQNYPNPFNPSTNISFSMAEPGFVDLKVYSTSGALVATLESGYRSAGSHSILFDASALPSGVYIYELTTAQASLTKKMVLIK